MITGGAGFIGSHVVRRFVNNYPDYMIVCVDKLTYAGSLANLRDVEDKPNYRFEKADICDLEKMRSLMKDYNINGVIHLAAESHVDRSISDPFTFARTNVMGTLSLLQAAKEFWVGALVCRYLQRSGIPTAGRKHGSHVLRHSLASRLLEHEVPLPVISEILGHTSTQTTMTYLRINIAELKKCALEVTV